MRGINFLSGCGIAAALLIAGCGIGAAVGQEAEPGAVIEGGDTPAENGDPGPAEETAPAQELPTPTQVAPADPVAAPEAEPVAEPRENYPGCEFNNIQECDLAAQQSMAESTLWMNRAAWVGVFLTVIGLALLAKTMFYTRDAAIYAKAAADAADRAVDEAREATAAAKEAVEVTRETAKRQLRAYICAAKPRVILGDDGLVTCTVRFLNTGQTPAYNFKVWVAAGIRPYPFDDPLPTRPDDLDHESEGTIGPSNRATITAKLAESVPAREREMVKADFGRIFFLGRATYRDAFGDEWRTDFRLFYWGPWGGKRKMMLYPEGNDAT